MDDRLADWLNQARGELLREFQAKTIRSCAEMIERLAQDESREIREFAKMAARSMVKTIPD